MLIYAGYPDIQKEVPNRTLFYLNGSYDTHITHSSYVTASD